MYTVDEIKQNYQKGIQIKLEKMEGEDLPKGLIGQVQYVDDLGQIHMSWENGSSLALNIEVDQFSIFTRKKENNLIDVVIVKPKQHPYVTQIKNELKSFQQIVGGYIEMVYMDDKIDLICHEEGKLIGLDGNRRVQEDIIAGPFIIVAHDEMGNCCSLDKIDIEFYLKRFETIEEYTTKEVQDCLWMRYL